MQKSSPAKESQALVIGAGQAKLLTKNQQQFNALIAKIEKLREEIPAQEERFETLLKHVNEHSAPMIEKLAKARLLLASALDAAASKEKFSKRQKEDIGICIVHLCDAAFGAIEAGEDEKALYDRWADMSYDEQETMQNEAQRAMFEGLFGVSVDWDEIEKDPSKIEDVAEEIRAKQEQHAKAYEAEWGRQESKSQKRAAEKKETLRKAAEELKSKSVRTIYISLAKLLHPDMETDPNLRAGKEEEMRKAIEAYEQNDLATLLKMELEWIHKQNSHLDTIPDEKLKLFVEVLRDQVKELELEKYSMRMNPRYQPVADFAYGKIETATRKIKADAARLEESIKYMNSIVKVFQQPNVKKQVVEFAEEYVEEIGYFSF